MQNYNLLHSWADTTEDSPGISEPVSVAELKNYLRLEGFDDDLSSTATVSFDTDDDLLEMYIPAAREKIESFTGCSLIPKNFRVELTNGAGNIDIPFGPVGDVTALYYDGDDDLETNEVDEIKLTRGHFPQIKSPCLHNMVIEYSCGYGRGDTPPLPEALKLAILAQAANDYMNRGEDINDTGACERAKRLAAPYVKHTWLA